MDIGVNARTFSVSEPGGGVQVGIQLTHQLRRLSPGVILFGHERVVDEFPDVKIDSTGYAVESLAYGLGWEQIVLPWLGARHDIDVLFSPNTYCPLRDTSFEKVIAVQGLSSFHGFSPKWYRRFRKVVVPQMLDAADAVVTVSRSLEHELADRFGISTDKTRVVYNGIDGVYLNDAISSDYVDVPDEYVLYVGAISENKNVENILRSYRRLRATHDIDHELVLVGSVSNPAVRTLSASEFGDEIHYPGYIDSERRLKYVYEHADAFVFPSFYESFGLPPLEAMACGTPVVASDIAALHETLGDAALFVDPHDHTDIAAGLGDVLADADLAEDLAARGRERAEKYTWERAGTELYDVFESL